MVQPGGDDLGDAYVDVHANTDPFEREVRDGVRKGAAASDADLKEVGEKMGETLGESMGDELESQGPHLARSVERGIGRQRIKTKVTVEVDRDNNVVRRWVSTITDEVRDAFDAENKKGGGGIFGNIGTIISDAAGAGFNVSGRSPLILLLIPLVGLIGTLIGALIQAVGALIALLYLIPSAIGAITLQVGVLFLAFKGVGTAIQGAFAAKNAEELNEAIKDLTPSAQEFVRSLLPLRDIFNAFRDVAQESFFTGFRGGIDELISAINRIGTGPIGAVAFALGGLFRTVLSFFDSQSFQGFVQDLLPSTVAWIEDFGPALLSFLIGLADLGRTVQPFFDWFGAGFNDILTSLGVWLTSLAYDPEFIEFLEDAKETLELLGVVLYEAINFLVVFWQELNNAGGQAFLLFLIGALRQLIIFFQSPIGQKALEGLIHALLLLSAIAFGLVVGILAVLAAFEYVAEWVKTDFLPFLEQVGAAAKAIFEGVTGPVVDAFNYISEKIQAFIDWLREKGRSVEDFFRNLWGIAANSFSLDTFIQAGKNIIGALISGMRSKLGELKDAAVSMAATIRGYLPFSPAKVGPLSGSGDTMIAGQKIIQRLVAGIEMATPDLATATNNAANNITFGPGSIRIGFEGAVPTPEQARATGSAVGSGINNQLALRGVRLQVRTL